jgi:hypothetical protein
MSFYNTGKDFTWFVGVVEDVMDPGMLGRVKIRVLNDQDANEVTTDELLWAYLISPIQSASLSSKRVDTAQLSPGPGAVGISPTGIEVGSYAFGFFLDGEERNVPMLFGTYHKIPDASKDSISSGEAAKSADHDVSFLAREQQTLYKEETKGDVQLKSKKHLNVDEGSLNPFLKEPKSAYAAKYPYNKTFTTRSGHAIELDDTPGEERIHVYHKAGTYTEINKDGRRVQKIVGSDWEIILENKNVLVKGNLNIEVDGDATILVKGDAYNWIKGNAIQAVLQNATQTVGESVSQTIGGDLVQVVNGSVNQTIQEGNLETTVESGSYTLNVAADMNVKVGGNIKIFANNNSEFLSGAAMNIAAVGNQKMVTSGTQLLQAAGDTTVNNNIAIVGTSTATVDHVSNGISGHNHTHIDSVGLGAGTTQPPQ